MVETGEMIFVICFCVVNQCFKTHKNKINLIFLIG